jgi:hypothetical protein
LVGARRSWISLPGVVTTALLGAVARRDGSGSAYFFPAIFIALDRRAKGRRPQSRAPLGCSPSGRATVCAHAVQIGSEPPTPTALRTTTAHAASSIIKLLAPAGALSVPTVARGGALRSCGPTHDVCAGAAAGGCAAAALQGDAGCVRGAAHPSAAQKLAHCQFAPRRCAPGLDSRPLAGRLPPDVATSMRMRSHVSAARRAEAYADRG